MDNDHTRRIAFYGKGGTGKSTIASNVSAAFSEMGMRVLHIGCDPKSDASRNLTRVRISTVLDMIRQKGVHMEEKDEVNRRVRVPADLN